MDRGKLIAAIVAHTGVKLDHDDPAFILVELNRLTLEASAGELASSIGQVADRFNAVATRNVDDFVDVANEALSKFIQRTNEIKAALDELKLTKQALEVAHAAPVAAAVVTTDEKKEPQSWRLWWLLPCAFLVGMLAGCPLAYYLLLH